MRVPNRYRGLGLGIFVLLLGPFFAAMLVSTSTHKLAVTAAPTNGAVEVSAVHELHAGFGFNEMTTPTPKPTPTPAPKHVSQQASLPAGPAYSKQQVQEIIIAAAQAHGVDAQWMLNTSGCESGFRWNAYNPGGPYIGIFQFLPSTFRAHGGTNIWDAVQQANIAASMFANGQSGAWPVCSKR